MGHNCKYTSETKFFEQLRLTGHFFVKYQLRNRLPYLKIMYTQIKKYYICHKFGDFFLHFLQDFFYPTQATVCHKFGDFLLHLLQGFFLILNWQKFAINLVNFCSIFCRVFSYPAQAKVCHKFDEFLLHILWETIIITCS